MDGSEVYWMEWYQSLIKPGWTPQPGTIRLIWMLLYPIILVSFSTVFFNVLRGRFPKRVCVPFLINLTANLCFTPILFGLRILPLASFDILIVWLSIVWMMVTIWSHVRWVAIAQIPYFVWVTIATVLQLSITWMNWGH